MPKGWFSVVRPSKEMFGRWVTLNPPTFQVTEQERTFAGLSFAPFIAPSTGIVGIIVVMRLLERLAWSWTSLPNEIGSDVALARTMGNVKEKLLASQKLGKLQRGPHPKTHFDLLIYLEGPFRSWAISVRGSDTKRKWSK